MGRRAWAVAVAVLFAVSACSLPPIDLSDGRPLALRTTITAADGTTLARLYQQHGGENRALYPIADVPDHLVDAVLAAEDARFFQHSGFDIRSIARAALVNVARGEIIQGGSTITQQYVKNTYFTHPGRTFERKGRELRLALEVERRFSKREILERYLNTVYFGQGAYGIKAGAETFFGHGVRTLTLPEAALLSALIKAPARYDPRDHPDRARARRNYVLDRMADLGHITRRRALLASGVPLGVTPDPPRIAIRQPYFVEAVKREVLSDRRMGLTEQERAGALWRGGLRIETTLDRELQRYATRAIEGVLNQPGDPEGALVAITPSNGEIVAMVGGRDWEASQVNLALGRAGGGSGRQPGSAFKPIVAASALESGIPLDARYQSGPATFTFRDGSTWSFGSGDYGLLPLDEALVHSVNGVYARLGLQLGPGQIATQAQLMGVRSRLPALPSIALGAAEVSVLDMASAYATLANEGAAIEPTTIRRIRLATGEIFKPAQRRIGVALSRGSAYLLTKVLEQVIQRGTGVAADIGRPAAGKTGTTNDYADAWFVGYTPDLVAAVWVGYPKGRIPMTSVHGIRVTGGSLPAAIWRNFMIDAHRGVPVSEFKLPKTELVHVEIDPKTELLAAPWCPGKMVRMLRQLAPTQYCPPPPPSPFPVPSASPTATGKEKRDEGKEGDSRKDEPSPQPRDRDGEANPKPSPSPEPSPKQSPRPEPSPSGG